MNRSADPSLEAFGELLRDARVAAGLSQRDLARIAGVDQSRISRLETANAPAMRADGVARIVIALGLGHRVRRHGARARDGPAHLGRPRVSRRRSARR